VGSLFDVRESYLYPKTVDTEVECQLALPSDKGCSPEGTSRSRPSRCTGSENVEAPDLTTVKDFFRFCAATGKGKIITKITCDSPIAVVEWFFAGFNRVTDTQTNEGRQKEICNLSVFCHLWPTPDPTLTISHCGSCDLNSRRVLEEFSDVMESSSLRTCFIRRGTYD